MKVTADHPNGRRYEWSDEGSNLTVGLAAQLFKCSGCGQSRFVEGGETWRCDNCGVVYTFEEDEAEQLGYLHPGATKEIKSSLPDE